MERLFANSRGAHSKRLIRSTSIEVRPFPGDSQLKRELFDHRFEQAIAEVLAEPA